MEETEKVHTRFVVGGVYRRQLPGGSNLEGMLTGATLHGSGRRNGVIVSESQAPVSVIENGATLDEWVLISEPINADLLRQFESSFLHDLQSLRARVEALESLEFARDPVTTVEPVKANPLDDLIATGARAKAKTAVATR